MTAADVMASRMLISALFVCPYLDPDPEPNEAALPACDPLRLTDARLDPDGALAGAPARLRPASLLELDLDGGPLLPDAPLKLGVRSPSARPNPLSLPSESLSLPESLVPSSCQPCAPLPPPCDPEPLPPPRTLPSAE